MHVNLKNDLGNVKQCKVGFSWTVFFFGFFVPFFRGDLKWGIILLVLNMFLGISTLGIGYLVVNLFFCFFYNKTYINGLLEKGYKPISQADSDILAQKM